MATLASMHPIPDAIMKLQVISCDVCKTNKASCDIIVEGLAGGSPVFKRCCDGCARQLAGQGI